MAKIISHRGCGEIEMKDEKIIRRRNGSALILAVVLTSLLAIVGMMFVMLARVDKTSTSAIAENKELNLAVDTVIARISGELAADVPGAADSNDPNLRSEYYDYPDFANRWLASLEPELDDKGTPTTLDDIYFWRQISDIHNILGVLSQNLLPEVVLDSQPVMIGGLPAPVDADGDGVSDSRWIMLPDITSSKGKPVYAAVRVVDNCGMLNVNTGFKFDPTNPNLLDGSSQMQINLMALSWRPGFTAYSLLDETDLLKQRANPDFGLDPNNLGVYERDVVWRYGQPDGLYTPFDISDELEMRNRFLLDHSGIDTRLEGWGDEFRNTISTPVPSGGIELDKWFKRAHYGVLDPNAYYYAYRHIGTTYNMDRIIKPDSERMFDVNRDTNAQRLYEVLRAGIDPNVAVRQAVAAQLAVNIIDFADNDANVTTLTLDPNEGGGTYYGFEAQPFISEVGIKINRLPDRENFNAYAVELYNPFDVNIPLGDFELELVPRDIADPCVFIGFGGREIKARSCFVIANIPQLFGIPSSMKVLSDPRLNLFHGWIPADKSKPVPEDRRCLSPDPRKPPIYIGWDKNGFYDLYLRRKVKVGAAERWIYIDKQVVSPFDFCIGEGVEKYLGRDVRRWPDDWRIVYQTLKPEGLDGLGLVGSLGEPNNVVDTRLFAGSRISFFLPNPLNPHRRFITIGDIPRVLAIGPGVSRLTVGEQLQQAALPVPAREDLVRLDLQNPYNRNVFQYLTVFDPNNDGIDNDGDGLVDETPEFKVPGRININTAPWYVMAQLPWVRPELVQAITAYRDKLDLRTAGGPDYYKAGAANSRSLATGVGNLRELSGFASTGELNFVTATGSGSNKDFYSIQRFGRDVNDLAGFPDLTGSDGIANDFEERDVIFSRISNLVTVRSDVFTAYILVRIGADGPQKRVVAILDRSDVYPGGGRVKVVAVQLVPDPR